MSRLSADSFISYCLSATIFLLTFFSVVHSIRHKAVGHPTFGRFVHFCGRRQRNLHHLLSRGYELRRVSCCILIAMIISVISPVSTLMEVEENVLTKACKELDKADAMREGMTLETCKSLAKTDGYTYVELSFRNSENHLIQIAVWPAMAVVYGFLISGFVRIYRKSPDQELGHIIEEAPHFYHVAQFMLLALTLAAGWIQNQIWT